MFEKAFEVLKGAFAKGGKWGDMMPVIVPEEKNVFPMMMIIGGGFMCMGEEKHPGITDEFKKIMTDSGFDMSDKKKKPVDMNALEDPAKMRAEADKVFKGKDVVKFLNAMQAFMTKYDDKKEMDSAFSELSDVKIDGDKATGKVKMGEKETKEFEFTKIDGRWYISLQKMFK